MSEVRKYSDLILSGSKPACKWVRLACERFERDLKRTDLWFDSDEADMRIEFFRQALTLENGAPFVLPDWQAFIVGNLYGWRRPDDRRRFQQALILVPRKNAKSTLMSGLGISSFFLDKVFYQQFYCIASDRGQANLLKDYGEGFVKRSPDLMDSIEPLTWEMRNNDTNSKWKALHADWRRLDGLNPYWVCYDEFHAAEGPEVDNVLNSAFGSQPEYLYIKISTAGEYRREKPCVKQQHYGEQVLEGVIERDNYFYVNFTVDEDDDWKDPAIWEKSNPNLHISKSIEYMQDLCNEAQDMPSKLSDFKTKQLNMWVESDTVWIPVDKWEKCGGKVIPRYLHGRKCFGGLDLAKVSDLSALTWLFPPDDHFERWEVLCRFWVPQENIERRSARDKVPYSRWRDEGFICATEGDTTDYEFIFNDIIEDARNFNVQDIGFDRVFGHELVNRLVNEGLDMVPFGQGFLSMAMPTAEIERMVLRRMLNHGNNPVLSWNCSNAVISLDPAGNMKIDKKRSAEKVDGMVALAMSVGRAMACEVGDSVYEVRDIRTL